MAILESSLPALVMAPFGPAVKRACGIRVSLDIVMIDIM